MFKFVATCLAATLITSVSIKADEGEQNIASVEQEIVAPAQEMEIAPSLEKEETSCSECSHLEMNLSMGDAQESEDDDSKDDEFLNLNRVV
jgi:hypothetical protein